MRIALAQFDFPVGDIAGNAERIGALIARARDEAKADLGSGSPSLSSPPPAVALEKADATTKPSARQGVKADRNSGAVSRETPKSDARKTAAPSASTRPVGAAPRRVPGPIGPPFGSIRANQWALVARGNVRLASGLATLDVFSMRASSGGLAWASRFAADSPWGAFMMGATWGLVAAGFVVETMRAIQIQTPS
jgi:hypothetical protein